MTAPLALDGVRVEGRDRPRLDGVTLRAERGLVVLIGPNGSGKTTLLRALLGLVRPAAGAVQVDGRDPAAMAARDRAACLAWLPQAPAPEDGLTARDLVATARFRFRERWRHACDAADAVLAGQGLGALAGRAMTSLSGGEAQRVRLAALHAQEAAWWLLDEPGTHLDPGVQLDLLDAVAARVRAGGDVVLVTHHLPSLAHLDVDDARVIGLDAGRVALDAALRDPDLPARAGGLVGLDLRIATLDGRTRWVVAGRAP